jgi:hypothetical protein
VCKKFWFAPLQAACAAFLSPNAAAKTITFRKGGWGLTYANKTREAQVLLAGSIWLERGEYEWTVKHTNFYIVMLEEMSDLRALPLDHAHFTIFQSI